MIVLFPQSSLNAKHTSLSKSSEEQKCSSNKLHGMPVPDKVCCTGTQKSNWARSWTSKETSRWSPRVKDRTIIICAMCRSSILFLALQGYLRLPLRAVTKALKASVYLLLWWRRRAAQRNQNCVSNKSGRCSSQQT
eukprot:5125644-Amphidinium_carterae.1